MMRRRLVLLCASLLLVTGCFGGRTASTPPDANVSALLAPPLSEPALARRIAALKLASRIPEGRTTYLMAELKAAGVQPGWRGGYLQPVEIVGARPSAPPAAEFRSADGVLTLLPEDGQRLWSARGDLSQISVTDAPLVFVGYGVRAPELNWDDYQNVDLTGRVAVILSGEPARGSSKLGFGKEGAAGPSRYADPDYKLREAASHGAIGALLVRLGDSPTADAWAAARAEPVWALDDASLAKRLQVEGWLSEEAAKLVFRRAKLDLAKLAGEAEAGARKPLALPGLAFSAAFDLNVERDTVNNIVGIVPGIAGLDETIVYAAKSGAGGACAQGAEALCATLDHARWAGLLELARRFATEGRVRRSIAFVAFEPGWRGELGAQRLAAKAPFSMSKVVTAIDLASPSVIGPARDVAIAGYAPSELDDMLAALSGAQGRRFRAVPLSDSDPVFAGTGLSFARAGTPTLALRPGLDLVRGGVDRGYALQQAVHYGIPTDPADPDLTGYVLDLQIAYRLGRTLAEGDRWPRLRGADLRAGRPR